MEYCVARKRPRKNNEWKVKNGLGDVDIRLGRMIATSIGKYLG